eukprot:4064-Pleurochrysis_carterae.AAC.2
MHTAVACATFVCMPHRAPSALMPQRTLRLREAMLRATNLLVASCFLHLHLRTVNAYRMFCKMGSRRVLPLKKRSVLDAFPLPLVIEQSWSEPRACETSPPPSL